MPDRPGRGRWPTAPVIYEIYPRSFRDTTGSGEGDINGITSGLDYIASLGVDAVWIAPFFLTGFQDGGYDVIDHRVVDPRFGTLADFDRLVERAHDLGLLVIIDQVLNHSSDQHELFLRSIQGNESCAAAYVWRDAKPDGTAPNNWLSFFGPPAWTWNHKRQQYYLHQYLPSQPSFNLRNADVQAKHRDEMRFWLNRGVDGFRLDAVSAYLFDERLPDNPPARPETRHRMAAAENNPYSMQNHIYDLLPGDGASYAQLLRDWAGQDVWLLGEINTGNNSVEVARDFVCPEGLDAAYVVDLPESDGAVATVIDMIDRGAGDGSIAWWMTSHDQPRRAAETPGSARFYLLLQAILPGPMMVYQGEELALPRAELSRDEITDPFDLMYWPDGPGREEARVPIPWTETPPRYGFSEGTPWLPMRWPEGASVAAGGRDGVLSFFRAVIDFRKEHGFGAHRVRCNEPNPGQLELILTTGTGDWLARFNQSDRHMPAPEAPPNLCSHALTPLGLPPGGGAIWRR